MMKLVLHNDICHCANGSVPCGLRVTNRGKMEYGGRKVAVKTDAMVQNLSTFGLCNNLANPAVAAAQGVLTPAPCSPMLIGMWQDTSNQIKIDGQPVVTEQSKVSCGYGGTISVSLVGMHGIEVG